MNKSTKSAIGIVFDGGQRKVLLVKRRDVPIWVLPGGGVDAKETPAEAVIREIAEETGIQAGIVRHVAIYSPINNLAYPTYVYECKPLAGQRSLSAETIAVDFFDLHHLPDPFFFIHREWIDDALLNKKYVICRDLTQITYPNLFKYFVRHPLLVFRALLSRLGIPYNDHND